MNSNRLANDAGILATNTWRYYIQNFGCSHFKGRGIEDNIYLLRPLFLDNGERVRNRATFRQAKEAGIIVERVDYILNCSNGCQFFLSSGAIRRSGLLFPSSILRKDLFLEVFPHVRHQIAARARNLREET